MQAAAALADVLFASVHQPALRDDTPAQMRAWLPERPAVASTAALRVAQRSATTTGQKTFLAALKLGEPPRFFDFTVPSA